MASSVTLGCYVPRLGRSIGASNAVATIPMGLGCVVAFLLLNPFLALTLIAILSLYADVPKYVFLLVASLAFAVFFNAREFGVEWYPGSTDDIPQYLGMYQADYGLSIQDLFENFASAPNGNELLWHVPWWVLQNYAGLSEASFIFLHYWIVFLTVFVSLRLVSKCYWILLVAMYFFLTPLTVDAVAHIWRQQLAFTMFLSGVALLLVRGKSRGLWLIYMSPLMHVSVIFFVLGYWAFRGIQRTGWFNYKFRTTVLIGILFAVVPVLSAGAVMYLDSIGIQRILTFFEGRGTDVVRVYLLIIVYALPMLGAFYLLRNDALNHLLLLLCFSVFSLVVALPGANGIYDRLLMFSLPLMGLYFIRAFLANFSARLWLPVIFIAILVGGYRLYLPTRESSGVLHFVANGQGLDPTMGLFRILGEY
jgi:EpsG family